MIWFEKYKSILIGIGVLLVGGIIFMNKTNGHREPTAQLMTNGSELEMENTIEVEAEPESTKMYVDLKGAVKNPGIYEANEGDRVFDIIERSGGLLETADENQINFAQKISDELIIYVPKIGEITENSPIENSTSSKNDKININKADSTELQSLPGIGPAKAAAIIEFREQQGPFKEIEEITKVSGIGAKTFERLQELITVH